MKVPSCPFSCSLTSSVSPKSDPVIRNGRFFRKSDSQWIHRFYCRCCKKHFSRSTHSPTYRQKKRRLSHPLKLLLCSGVSQRRAALILGVNPKTVVRRFRFLAAQARLDHHEWLTKNVAHNSLNDLQWDDLETAEHTKCKPLSVSLIVDAKTRRIYAFEVARMPAKGHLSQLALRKYGKRADERPKGWEALHQRIKPWIHPKAKWVSDQNPHYPRYLKHHHPLAEHLAVPGRRGCVAGQGELKKIGFDPLFSLNHTCAMLRANLNRLFRRSWCLSKTLQGLNDHIALYIQFHNHQLTSEVGKIAKSAPFHPHSKGAV